VTPEMGRAATVCTCQNERKGEMETRETERREGRK
jgi:hypothetical protein